MRVDFWHLSSTDIIERDSFHLGGIRAEEKVFQFALKDEYMGFQERKGLILGCHSRRNSMGVSGEQNTEVLAYLKSLVQMKHRGWSCLPEVMFFQTSRLRPANG